MSHRVTDRGLLAGMVRIGDARIHRADLHTLRLIEVASALHTGLPIDDVDLISLTDRLGWTLSLARGTGDAFVGDHVRHCSLPPLSDSESDASDRGIIPLPGETGKPADTSATDAASRFRVWFGGEFGDHR